MKVEIAGYPTCKIGHPYTHNGQISDISGTKQGGHLIWYDADSTIGNSGSCIMVTDEDFVKSVTKEPGIRKVIVAVHAGYDEVANLNFGTLITESVHDWLIKEKKEIANC